MKEHGPAERTTIRQYRQHIDLHIVPLIGRIKLSQLNTKVVEGFRDDLLEKLKSANGQESVHKLQVAA